MINQENMKKDRIMQLKNFREKIIDVSNLTEISNNREDWRWLYGATVDFNDL